TLSASCSCTLLSSRMVMWLRHAPISHSRHPSTLRISSSNKSTPSDPRTARALALHHSIRTPAMQKSCSCSKITCSNYVFSCSVENSSSKP
ncbi:hypothetical protein BDR04DRAFT_1111246, partial [Suillus decipiens]